MPLACAQAEEVRRSGLEPAPQDDPLIDGLRQRARLFEWILADLLGPRTILARGLLPASFAPGSSAPAERRGLRAYAAELVRCPDSIWRVAGDFTAGVANHPRASLLEGPALGGFLPGLCRFLLGESLRLESVPSRWLADPGALQNVVASLHRWAIVDAFGRGPAIRLVNLTVAQRTVLQDQIAAAPWRFAARLLVEGDVAYFAFARAEQGRWMRSSGHPITLNCSALTNQ